MGSGIVKVGNGCGRTCLLERKEEREGEEGRGMSISSPSLGHVYNQQSARARARARRAKLEKLRWRELSKVGSDELTLNSFNSMVANTGEALARTYLCAGDWRYPRITVQSAIGWKLFF